MTDANCPRAWPRPDTFRQSDRRLQNYQYNSTERQQRSQNLAAVLVIISGNSLVFSRKIITSTGFYRCCAAGASAPVVVQKISLPEYGFGEYGFRHRRRCPVVGF